MHPQPPRGLRNVEIRLDQRLVDMFPLDGLDRRRPGIERRIDVAFRLGVLEDSSLRMRGIMDCERVLVAAPAYLARTGRPRAIDDLNGHAVLRYSGLSLGDALKAAMKTKPE